MTLGDLIKTGWVKDDDKLYIGYGYGKRVNGNWYEDKILNLTGRVIDTMIYGRDGDAWAITLSGEEERAEELNNDD